MLVVYAGRPLLLLGVLAVYEDHVIWVGFCWQWSVVACHDFGGELLDGGGQGLCYL